jgi:hypothetical protein
LLRRSGELIDALSEILLECAAQISLAHRVCNWVIFAKQCEYWAFVWTSSHYGASVLGASVLYGGLYPAPYERLTDDVGPSYFPYPPVDVPDLAVSLEDGPRR